MTINKEDFLSFAKSLPEDSEINLRNSMSRAYYAAYHGCGEIYAHDRSAAGGVHNQLIEGLKHSPNINDRKLGFILDQLRSYRTMADYFLSQSITLSDKQVTIKQTEKLLELLAEQNN